MTLDGQGSGPKSPTILVVGGGIAGITAALEGAETGHEVVLLEKGLSLGGRAAAGREYDTYDDPAFLDDFATALGAEAVAFQHKTACCGGSVAVMSPDRTLHLIKNILGEAKQAGADVISTPCPLCQTNVEMSQGQINEKFGTDYDIPVVFYSQLMAVAFGLAAMAKGSSAK